MTIATPGHLNDLSRLEEDPPLCKFLEELQGLLGLQMVLQVLEALPDSREKEGDIVILHPQPMRVNDRSHTCQRRSTP